jgi:general stress protein 26
MTPELRTLTLDLLDNHRIMTIATNRPDGWPQATVVGYSNEGLTIYCFIARTSQKYSNIVRDKRLSIAIASDFPDPLQIRGLSMAATAAQVDDIREYDRAYGVLLDRYPEYAKWPRPTPALAPMLRITPKIISILDYSKGFGHSDLVTVTANDLIASKSDRSNWLASG